MGRHAGRGVLTPLAAPPRTCSEAVVGALSTLSHGYDQLDRALIVHAALVSAAYRDFHRAWLQAVQVCGACLSSPGPLPAAGAALPTRPPPCPARRATRSPRSWLQRMQQGGCRASCSIATQSSPRQVAVGPASPSPAQQGLAGQHAPPSTQPCILPPHARMCGMQEPDGSYGQMAYAAYFPDEIAAIVKEMDNWIMGARADRWLTCSCPVDDTATALWCYLTPPTPAESSAGTPGSRPSTQPSCG